MPELSIKFDRHGLGDCVHMAHALQLYKRRGYDITVQVEENKMFVWQVAGVTIVQSGDLPDHPFIYPSDFDNLAEPDHEKNKMAFGLRHDVMWDLGDLGLTQQQAWNELCAVRLSAYDHIPAEAHAETEIFLEGLPRPIVCLHSRGTNWHERKSIPTEVAFDVILKLLDQTGGSVVVLDFDRRAPMVGDARCKGIKPSWGHIGIDRLCALYERCDLMIGVDSGPFHVASFTSIKALGVFRSLQPTRVCLPNPNAVYMVNGKHANALQDRDHRWQFAYYDGAEPTADDIVDSAIRILNNCTPTPSTKVSRVESNNQISGRYEYHRVGHDRRPLELRPDGTIGEGNGDCERKWFFKQEHDKQILFITGKHGVTCQCERDTDGVFRGRWTQFERMPIEITRLGESDLAQDSLSESPSIALVINWDEGYSSIANVVIDNRRQYASQHDYQLFESHYAGSWGKLNAMLDAWDKADWLWWLDADACVTDMTQRLEPLLADNYDVVATCDRNGISAGSMLIRTCAAVKAIFEDVLKRREEFDWPNGLWEQNGLMWQFWKIKDRVQILSQDRLNSYAAYQCVVGSHAWQPGDFVLHCAGISNEKRIQLLSEAVANASRKSERYDLDRYPDIWTNPEWSVDRRHIFWLYDVLCAGRFRNALEIGSLHGACSTAFVEAVNQGHLQRATLCDTQIRPSVRRMVNDSHHPNRIRLFEGRSVDVLASAPFDFVFVDGDHLLATVKEEMDQLERLRPVCVMAHDTNSTAAGIPGCEGPQYLKERFKSLGYHCLEDCKTRPGEGTQRGMFLATTSREVLEAAKQVVDVNEGM